MSKKYLKSNVGFKIFIVILVSIAFGVFLGGYLFGKRHESKEMFCYDFARTYLEDFMSKETQGNNSLWEAAIDIETDMYNLCILGPNKESLENFNSVVIKKYQNNVK